MNDITTTDQQDQPNDSAEVDADTRSQIRERLTWTPAQRLVYLKGVVAFEQRARRAHRVA